MRSGSKIIAIALLLVGLVLVNYLAASFPMRYDATSEKIYTLSPGTKALLSKVTEPTTLDLYFSANASGQFVEYKNYAERVREMLRQYVRASHGMVRLNVVDPEPDTPEEEKATAAGIEPQTIPGGSQFYFGLVATQADQQKVIPALTPQREQFLEYDVSELIYGVGQVEKKKLGLITSLPLQGSPGMPMMGQQGTEGQYVVSEWEETYQIVPVDASATDLPKDLDVLAIVHPENLSAKLQYSIDQFLLAGKPVFIAVDPSSLYFKRQGGQAAMFGGPQPNISSDLPVLLGGWGVAYDPNMVVGDLENAEEVQLRDESRLRYPVWINLTQDDFNPKALPTAQLETALFIEPGSVKLKPGTDLTFTPLIETSDKSGEIPVAALQFAQPDEVARQVKASGKRTIAALITGRFKSAFPDGAPKDPEPADKKDARADAAPAGPQPLKESRTSSILIIVADTDWLFDDYCVQKFDFMGQAAAKPFNDNLAFAANSLDFLSGSRDLISIRGKGNSVRPFTVVTKMEAEAAEKYKEKLTALEARINEVQGKLAELQGKTAEGGKLLASPEATRAIEDFQKQAAAMRAERRGIRLALREGIDSLENRLLVINLLATPALVVAFGLWFYRRRRSA
jgi:gliding motility-associatede transport system auxiliary component